MKTLVKLPQCFSPVDNEIFTIGIGVAVKSGT